jgi:tetratricopeptide (TPR) repeat protein
MTFQQKLQLFNRTKNYSHSHCPKVRSHIAAIKSQYSQSLDYFHRLLRRLYIDHVNRPDVYYDLGCIYCFLEKYHKALTYFRCAELLLRRLLSFIEWHRFRLFGVGRSQTSDKSLETG